MVDTTALVNELIDDLKIKLQDDPAFDGRVLGVIVKAVVREFIQRRDYPESMSDDTILADMNKYYSTMLNLSEYDYNMIGAEGQKSHNENGVNRTFVDRNSFFNDVYKYVRFL